MDAPLRCFVAIDLPSDLKLQLTALITALRASVIGDKMRWVRPDGIHLTLKFLGDVPSPRQPEIETAVREALASSQLAPFELSVGGLGVFPHAEQPRVLWVGLSGDLPALNQCQKQVEQALAAIGFLAENRAFSPHLTLGRVPDLGVEVKADIGHFVTSFQTGELSRFTVSEVVLMESVLHPDGAIYTPLSRFDFEQFRPIK